MTTGEMGAPEGVPIAPLSERKTFEVWWVNPDLAITTYSGITGSHLDGDILFLMTPDGRERIVNLAHVRCAYIWNDDDQDR